jgi:hypothetical protein
MQEEKRRGMGSEGKYEERKQHSTRVSKHRASRMAEMVKGKSTRLVRGSLWFWDQDAVFRFV